MAFAKCSIAGVAYGLNSAPDPKLKKSPKAEEKQQDDDEDDTPLYVKHPWPLSHVVSGWPI